VKKIRSKGADFGREKQENPDEKQIRGGGIIDCRSSKFHRLHKNRVGF